MASLNRLEKIVIVSDYAFVNGGAARVALGSALALAEIGVKVHVFAGVGPVWPELANRSNLEVTCLNAVPYNESGFRRSAFAGLWDRMAQASLKALLASVSAERTVVHIHSQRDALSSSIFRPVLEGEFPLVYTCHEYGLACPYASFFDHKTNSICTRRPLSLSCVAAHCNRKGFDRKLWTVAKQSIQNRWLRIPNRLRDIVFVSEYSRRILEPYVGPRPRKHTVPNPAAFSREAKRVMSSEAPFLFVGLLTPGKGPEYAAAAARRAGVPIRFVGDGDARNAVETANPTATITGWLSPERVRDEMRQARALILPALWYETQGLVVQEAAALGVPAIVSRTCAAGESIDDGCTGILVQPGNTDDLASAMNRLHDDGLAKRMGSAAYRKFWDDPPTMEKYLEQIMQIYEEALTNA